MKISFQSNYKKQCHMHDGESNIPWKHNIHKDKGEMRNYRGQYHETLYVVKSHLKIGARKFNSSVLQWLDLKIGQQNIRPSNGLQGEKRYSQKMCFSLIFPYNQFVCNTY